MTRRKQPLNARLAELGQSVAAVEAHARDVEHDQAAARGDVDRLVEERIEAFAAGDDTLAEKLAAGREQTDARVAPGAAHG